MTNSISNVALRSSAISKHRSMSLSLCPDKDKIQRWKVLVVQVVVCLQLFVLFVDCSSFGSGIGNKRESQSINNARCYLINLGTVHLQASGINNLTVICIVYWLGSHSAILLVVTFLLLCIVIYWVLFKFAVGSSQLKQLFVAWKCISV